MHRIKEAHSQRLSVCHEGGMQKNGRRSVSGVVNLPLEAGKLMIRLAIRQDCTICVFSMQVLTMKKNLIISRSTLLIPFVSKVRANACSKHESPSPGFEYIWSDSLGTMAEDYDTERAHYLRFLDRNVIGRSGEEESLRTTPLFSPCRQTRGSRDLQGAKCRVTRSKQISLQQSRRFGG